MTNAVLWVEVVIFAVFAGLRLYTRKHILNAVGADDYLVLISLVRESNVPRAQLHTLQYIAICEG